MIITDDILDEMVPEEMMPTRLDSALNLYTNIKYNGKTGILMYNISPETWNCLYQFYEANHKFTIDNYSFSKEKMTYRELISEYKAVYKKVYEDDGGNTKDRRKDVLISEYKRTFNLDDATIVSELKPIFELKFSKSKNVWTLYYFENYVANNVKSLDKLLKQEVYNQKILPLDPSIKEIDGIMVGSNIPYMLSIEENVLKLKNNLMDMDV